jgi:hypothetical protein
VNLRREKGFSSNQFYSDIIIKRSQQGFDITATAFADSMEDARIAAHVYLDRMKDVLCITKDIPLLLSNDERGRARYDNRLLLGSQDFIDAFDKARVYEQHQPELLRAMGWYAKGKTSTNAYDQFFAYWSVIEILGVAYHEETERTNRGQKNKIYQCFLDYFGTEENWLVPQDWIDKAYLQRNELYHGGTGTTLEEILQTAHHIDSLSYVSLILIRKIQESVQASNPSTCR